MKIRLIIYGAILLSTVMCLMGHAQARVINDAEYGFRITIPDDWQTKSFMDGSDKVWAFAARDNNAAVRVRTFKVSPGLSIEALISGFEDHILSGGQKLIIKPYTLNGVHGKMAGYKGKFNNTDVGVGCFYAIHGRKAYIVWSMIPIALFDARSGETDAIMNTFTLTKMGEHHRTAKKLFHEKGAGYTIEYPESWTYEKSGRSTVIFSGPAGTKAYFSTVSIQNLLSEKAKSGTYRNVDALVEDLLKQLAKTKGLTKSAIEPFTYSKGHVRLAGKQFMGEYTKSGEKFRQWTIVIPRPTGDAFHTWFYTSPIPQYNEFLGIAKAMLESWVITE